MITISNKGSNFSKTIEHLEKLKKFDERAILEKYGKIGVDALKAATPVRTGKTANSWYYEIKKQGDNYILSWNNSNENKGKNIAVLIQYGHGTSKGGYVRGINYINPAMKTVFEQLVEELRKEVSKL